MQKAAIAIFLLVAVVIATFIVRSAINVRQERRLLTAALDGGIGAVQINDTPLAEPAPMVEALRDMNISPFRFHHSHPTNSIKITLKTATSKDIVLLLARDSGTRNQYWVYRVQHDGTLSEDIGFITAPILDTY